MPTRDQIQAVLETRFAAKLVDIQQRQDQFYAAHGRYWQGPATTDDAPADGEEVTPDPDRKAHGETLSWRDMGGLPATLGSQLSIHTYDGPSGKGYAVCLRFRSGGELRERVWNFGPDTTQATSGWRTVKEGPIP